MVWWRGECGGGLSKLVPSSATGEVALRAEGDFGLAGGAVFLSGRGFFWSFRSFKPYKSFDAVAEVNLYGLAEGEACGGGLSKLVPSSATGEVALGAGFL
jgi:hypothetical protein